MSTRLRAVALTLAATLLAGTASAQQGGISYALSDTLQTAYCSDCAEPTCGCEEDDCCSCCDEPTCECGDAACGDECGSACGDACGSATCDACAYCEACGKKKKAKGPNPCAKSHKGLFYANDFSYLKKPGAKPCFGDCLKLMPVGECGRFGTLDIGGQMRLRFHDEEGQGVSRAIPGFDGFQDTENTFLLSRLRLYGNWKVNSNLRVFVEGIYADATGNTDYNFRAPIDRNHGDLLNAFVDVNLTDNFLFRVGRQELLLGSQRLVSPLDWANTRRTWEGFRGTYAKDDWVIDGWYLNLVPVVVNDFDEADYDQSFYGVWSQYTGRENAVIDTYYLGLDDQRAAFQTSVHTLGGRANGKAFGKWLYDVEGGFQFGNRGVSQQDIAAGFVTGGLGRQLNKAKWNPTVWFYIDYASGDNGNVNGDFNGFNQLFPLAHKYLGFIDSVARNNIISPNVLLTMKPHEKWNLLFWYYNFTAVEEEARIPGVANQANQLAGEESFGNELDFIAKYTIGPRQNVLFGWSHLWRGAKILGTNDANFFYTQWTLNF